MIERMLSPTKSWHVLEIINRTKDYLSQKGFENPKLNAEKLLGYSLNMSRVDLYLNYDRPLSKEELERFKKYLKRRLDQEPLQYILGETEFMSLPFKVNSTVLIPRPETEILVEKVLEKCQEKFNHKPLISILDIGTGSGCIAVSLAKYIENVKITALDISEDALKTAAENACLNSVENKIQFYRIDFLVSQFSNNPSQKFDVVVSNPPYVSEEDFKKLPKEIKDYEPIVALKDDGDGMTFYHKIAGFASINLNTEGFVAVEVGLGQAPQVQAIFMKNGFSNVTVFQDLTGIQRVVYSEN